jgi:hypothetical protein
MAMRPASQRALERQANEAKTWGRTIATGMRLIPTMLRVWMAENIRTVESEPVRDSNVKLNSKDTS